VAILTNDARARRSQRPPRIVAYIETHVLIPPTSYACSLARFVTTSLYSATVSQALRQPLRAGGLLERSWQNPKNLASRISDLLDRETAPNARDMQNLKFMVNVRRLTVLSIRPYSSAQNTPISSSFVSRYLDCGSRSVGGKLADPGCLHKLEIEVQDCGT
jgi:hypothetical protein